MIKITTITGRIAKGKKRYITIFKSLMPLRTINTTIFKRDALKELMKNILDIPIGQRMNFASHGSDNLLLPALNLKHNTYMGCAVIDAAEYKKHLDLITEKCKPGTHVVFWQNDNIIRLDYKGPSDSLIKFSDLP